MEGIGIAGLKGREDEMINIDVDDDFVTVSLRGWDRILALRKTLRLPLNAVKSVRPAPELIRKRPRGFRFPGTSLPFWPGPVFAGSYVDRNRHWTFWAVRRPSADRLLAVEVEDRADAGRYRKLVLQVADPSGDARRIQQAADEQRLSMDR